MLNWQSDGVQEAWTTFISILALVLALHGVLSLIMKGCLVSIFLALLGSCPGEVVHDDLHIIFGVGRKA